MLFALLKKLQNYAIFMLKVIIIIILLCRIMLRNLVGVRYPVRITNDDLYSRCGSQPLLELVAKRRRSLTGHVLRMSEQSPPCPVRAPRPLRDRFSFSRGNRSLQGAAPAGLFSVDFAYLRMVNISMKFAA